MSDPPLHGSVSTPTQQLRIEEASKGLLKTLRLASSRANALPQAEDYLFARSFGSFRSASSSTNRVICDLLKRTIRLSNSITGSEGASLGGGASEVVSEDHMVDSADVEEEQDPSLDTSTIADCVDGLLEFVDFYLDRLKEPSGPPIVVKESAQSHGKTYFNLFHASNVLRPQVAFKDVVDNGNERSWVPHSLRGDGSPHVDDASLPHDNPFKHEMASYEFLPSQLEKRVPLKYRGLQDTRVSWVDTREQLVSMARTLETQDEFAIDLENHSYRSFQGFTCLMQVSTREEDFLVDVLAVREHMFMLSSSFHNPSILKVLHGADHDILWLQRDFGLYIINMFDTGQAARILELPRFSLAHLLERYCNIKVDKKYQLADWRIRPLPAEMAKYAREDTHYLLYVADVMRNELLDRGNVAKNLLKSCLDRSRYLCMQAYDKPRVDEHSARKLYERHERVSPLDPMQQQVFRHLFYWRDGVAREEDESERYVLPTHMMLSIAEKLPTTSIGLMEACGRAVPPLVRLQAEQCTYIVVRCKQDPKGAAEMSTTQLLDGASTGRGRSYNLSGQSFIKPPSEPIAFGSTNAGKHPRPEDSREPSGGEQQTKAIQSEPSGGAVLEASMDDVDGSETIVDPNQQDGAEDGHENVKRDASMEWEPPTMTGSSNGVRLAPSNDSLCTWIPLSSTRVFINVPEDSKSSDDIQAGITAKQIMAGLSVSTFSPSYALAGTYSDAQMGEEEAEKADGQDDGVADSSHPSTREQPQSVLQAHRMEKKRTRRVSGDDGGDGVRPGSSPGVRKAAEFMRTVGWTANGGDEGDVQEETTIRGGARMKRKNSSAKEGKKNKKKKKNKRSAPGEQVRVKSFNYNKKARKGK